MRKLLVGVLMGLAVLAGCGDISTWMALYSPSGRLIRYYHVRQATVPKSKIGRSDGALFMQGIDNGPGLWRTNIHTSKTIRIYAIIGVAKSHAIAIQTAHGSYFEATSTGANRP